MSIPERVKSNRKETLGVRRAIADAGRN